jgi:ribosomal protein S18 acetylase RimI-like enzyme
LFDEPARLDATRTFLESPTHHLGIAYEDDVPAGFVSGVETTHPDKGTEMFLYELAVDEAYRRRGIGRALVAALATLARDRGCYGMWVLTDSDNTAAVRTYETAGGASEGEQLMLGWRFDNG